MVQVVVHVAGARDVLHQVDAVVLQSIRMPLSTAAGLAWSWTASKVVIRS